MCKISSVWSLVGWVGKKGTPPQILNDLPRVITNTRESTARKESSMKYITIHMVHPSTLDVYYSPDLRDLAVLTSVADDNHHPSAIVFPRLPSLC